MQYTVQFYCHVKNRRRLWWDRIIGILLRQFTCQHWPSRARRLAAARKLCIAMLGVVTMAL